MLHVICYRCGVHFFSPFFSPLLNIFLLAPFLWDRSWQAGKKTEGKHSAINLFLTHLKTRWRQRIKLLLIRMIHILFIPRLRAGFSRRRLLFPFRSCAPDIYSWLCKIRMNNVLGVDYIRHASTFRNVINILASFFESSSFVIVVSVHALMF